MKSTIGSEKNKSMERVARLTPEVRKKVIDWVNVQDIFRTHSLFEFMGLAKGRREDNRLCQSIYELLFALRDDDCIQALEKNQYVVLKKAHYDIKIRPRK